MFYLPLCISIIAKVYEISTKKNQFNESTIEYFVILQGKLETFVVIYMVILAVFNWVTLNINIIGVGYLLALLILFRIKY